MTALRLHNTLSRSIETFEPLAVGGKKVGLYCCGPTVYDFGHIGNFRTFVFSDLVRRYLRFRGYDVQHVMNITDVDDKIIRRVRETGKTLANYTHPFETAFLEDLDTLNCLRPHSLPRATAHIPQMIAMIEQLLARGIAYRTPDGSIFFSIQKYQGCGCKYGQLVNLNPDSMKVGERVANDEYDKDSAADFALWKARVPEDGDVFWPSPFGEGRPGWHIECSAMSTAILGQSFDVHLGGEDLTFPHHEDEIAQCEGAVAYPQGERFVKYWLHCAHLLVEGKKMSKSLGNFFTIRDLIAKGYSGREIRFLLTSAHHRETFNFTLAGLDGARSALARIDECLHKLQDLTAGRSSHLAEPTLVLRFTSAMYDDLNVSKAWAVVFDWVHDMNRELATGRVTIEKAAQAIAAWDAVDAVFGIGVREHDEVPQKIHDLVDARAAAKKARDFAKADALRAELTILGWAVEDTPKGPKVKSLR